VTFASGRDLAGSARSRTKGSEPFRKEVISVTLLMENERTEITRTPAVRHVTQWVTGVMGAVAAAIGAYVYYAPTDWFLGDVAESWAFGLFTGAGILLATAFGVFARKAYLEDRYRSGRVMVATVLSVVAVAGAVTFALVWIL
jgi:hypothetical protein